MISLQGQVAQRSDVSSGLIALNFLLLIYMKYKVEQSCLLLLPHQSSYPNVLMGFSSKFSLAWSYLITVFGSRCFVTICTSR